MLLQEQRSEVPLVGAGGLRGGTGFMVLRVGFQGCLEAFEVLLVGL